ncbi:MAG: hypothetical protein RLZZ344_1029 [Pseudomonadota bacterium]|jgi:hypothetical protein
MTQWILSQVRALPTITVSIPMPSALQFVCALGLGLLVFFSVYHNAWWVLIGLLVVRLFWIIEPIEGDAHVTEHLTPARRRSRSRLAQAAVQARRTWHFAQVQYEYQCPENPSERLIDTETVQVYGKCEASALLSLRRLYPQRERLRVRSINRHFVEPTLD